MGCLQFLWLDDSDLARQIRRMAEIVSSDSVTRAFLQLMQKHGSSNAKVKRFFLLDRLTRKPVRVHSLDELPIGRLYLYGEGHTLVRCASDKVLLAGKVPIPLSVPSMPKAVQRCTPDAGSPAIRSGAATPEPAMKRHNVFLSVAMSRKVDADDDAAKQRRERRAAEARAKRHAAVRACAAITALKADSESDSAFVSDPSVLVVDDYAVELPHSPAAPATPVHWGDALD
mmetsp:Transcript_6967/g.17828  ORF Transcript_6967/g.17828 Transcript_6967/m.17828 type:complete len:229 (-) Transcript_6967:104-790(-)|eukprot:CAMPEP_0119413872 /NCGR_PEP_ID=MMETSP1335-20130426/6153_1 /TAXON_ID=259385 /ORGANISM="Chrysoculter rhomboideus, Strain RCC1486" /LENGTH=228 /DNA_ID=CAMNT_0007438703 /DNA_START=53 /DNA_END=739 /DNA_ORIENTATION=+